MIILSGPKQRQILLYVTVPRSSGGTVPKVENASDSDPGNVGYIVDTRHEEGGSKATSEKIGFAVGNCNLTNLKSMSLKVASSYTGASVYVYADSKDGDLVATGKIPNTGDNKIYEDLDLDIINNPGGTHVLYVLFHATRVQKLQNGYATSNRSAASVLLTLLRAYLFRKAAEL